MRSTFVCPSCDVLRSGSELVERRIEYRDGVTQARRAVLLDAKICRSCADAEVQTARPRPAGEQGSLAV